MNTGRVYGILIITHNYHLLATVIQAQMTQKQRYLMFLQKDGSGIVVEGRDAPDGESLKQEAEAKGMTCQLLTIENFYPDYRGYRYFDLRNPGTRETFSIDYVLEAWEADKRHHEGHEGTDEWFIH